MAEARSKPRFCAWCGTPLEYEEHHHEPRYATLRAIKQAEQKEIDVREPGDLGTPASRVRRMFVPPKGEGAEMLGDDPGAVAQRIKEIVDERKKT